ncbi:MAG: TIGR04255 family protein [Nitrospiraceae bacterium]|nr:TIGR04255 family protein [Nitrospiraceae bacterium]
MSKKLTSEVYPNSPLVEVIFEIRFPGEPVVECRRDIFYESVRREYSQVLVPQIKEGSFVALEPYRFEKKDKSSGVMLAMNKFSFYCRKYPGFAEFKKEFMKLLQGFRKAYPKIDTLTRTGFRYVNIIPFTREDGILPFSKFLKMSIQTPPSIPPQYENISLGLISKTANGSITARVETVKSADQKGEAILLDLDYAKEKGINIRGVSKYLEESHSFSRQLFEDLITDDYRAFLRGDTL